MPVPLIPAPVIVDPRPVPVPQRPLIPWTAVDGVFQGGGALGTAYVGALRYLESNNIWFKRVAGNSAGAITAAMIAAGFTAGEIQALSSAFLGRGSLPESLRDLQITDPITFTDFLDLPSADSISDENKRKTDLWHALNGTVIDVIGRIDVPVPSQPAAVDACLGEILDVPLLGAALDNDLMKGALRQALNAALAPLPDRPLRVRDFLPDTTALRRTLADHMWDAFAEIWPTLPLMTNLVHEGGLFEGRAITTVLKTLFGRKIHGNPDATVLFSDLKLPLAVIGANIGTGTMEVYNSRQHPSMDVVEAVRRSMSIPLVFEPRGDHREFVDGGLFSNFPVWLYSPAGRKYWPQDSVDDSRLKVGFLLDEQGTPARDAGAGRFPVSGQPRQVALGDALRPLLRDKLRDLGYPDEVVDSALRRLLGGGVGGQSEPGLAIIDELFGVVTRGLMKAEESTRAIITPAVMRDLPYVEISTPLLGFHALDFGVNGDRRAILEMWNRAWREANREFAFAKAKGSLPGGIRLREQPSPFGG